MNHPLSAHFQQGVSLGENHFLNLEQQKLIEENQAEQRKQIFAKQKENIEKEEFRPQIRVYNYKDKGYELIELNDFDSYKSFYQKEKKYVLRYQSGWGYFSLKDSQDKRCCFIFPKILLHI